MEEHWFGCAQQDTGKHPVLTHTHILPHGIVYYVLRDNKLSQWRIVESICRCVNNIITTACT